jgi:hypothetical protein
LPRTPEEKPEARGKERKEAQLSMSKLEWSFVVAVLEIKPARRLQLCSRRPSILDIPHGILDIVDGEQLHQLLCLALGRTVA